MTLSKFIGLILFTGIVTACGGGSSNGSGSNDSNNANSGDFTIGQNTISLEGDISGLSPTTVKIAGNIKNAKSTVYLVIDISQTNLFQSASVSIDSDTSGTLYLEPTPAYKLPVGTHKGVVTVRACKDQACNSQISGSPKTINVTYEVKAPDFTLATTSVSFIAKTGKSLPGALSINMSSSKAPYNYGYKISSGANEWLNVMNSWNGANGTATFSLEKAMPIGSYKATVDFWTHTENLKKSVNVTLTVEEGHIITLSQDTLTFDLKDSTSLTAQQSFKVNSKIKTAWSLEPDVDWLTLSKTSGNTDDSTAINLSLNSKALNLSKGIHTAVIFVRNQDDQSLSVHLPVKVYVFDSGVALAAATPYLFDFDAYAIASDEKNSRLYASDIATKRIYQIDMKTGQALRYFSFDKMPERMVISPDGSKLYVALTKGHYYYSTNDVSGAIGIIDLASGSLKGTYALIDDPYDLAITSTGKLIVSSGSNQWTNIYAYNADTGTEVGRSFIRMMSHLYLHPSEKWVFAANTDTSPSDIEKFDISGTGITALGNSPYHGDHRMDGNVWATPDGRYVITRGGDVFLATDMTYVQGLVANTGITDLAFNADKNLVMVINFENKLVSFGLSTLAPVTTLAIGLISPRFVFVQNGNTYVISNPSGKTQITKY